MANAYDAIIIDAPPLLPVTDAIILAKLTGGLMLVVAVGKTTISRAVLDYLAANVVDKDTRKPFLPPYDIKTVDGVKVGFIGMTLEGTPSIVSAAGIASVDFRDEVDTANALVRRSQR